MNPLPADAAVFESHLPQLLALVEKRLELQRGFHGRADLPALDPDLFDLARELGLLLRVVYRYGLAEALEEESAWYASALSSRGPGRDALTLLLDSWIVAIHGVVKPPECDRLARPLQEVRSRVDRILSRIATPPSTLLPSGVHELVDRLVRGEKARAQGLLESRIAAGLAPHEAITDLLLPAMVEVGRRWEVGASGIWEEHLATETALGLLAGLAASARPREALPRLGLVGCVPNDEHQLAPAALSAYLELRGWNAPSLGRTLPAEQVVLAAEKLAPHAVFLSMNLLARLHDAVGLVGALRRSRPGCPVFVGGRRAATARTWLEEAGARVVDSFEEAHREATGELPDHA